MLASFSELVFWFTAKTSKQLFKFHFQIREKGSKNATILLYSTNTCYFHKNSNQQAKPFITLEATDGWNLTVSSAVAVDTEPMCEIY